MPLLKFKKLNRIIYKLLSSLYDKPLTPPTIKEKKLVDELKSVFLELPIRGNTDCSPSEQEWFTNANRLRDLILNDDPREFLRWDVILRTMCVTYASYVTPELRYLKNHRDWSKRWRKAVEESFVGHPIPHWQYPRSSGNLIHHAYHIAQFEEKTATLVNDKDFVFEFGGGYGSMCRLVHNLGFTGKYVLFDLPAFSALQQFFLKSIGITVLPVDALEMAPNGVLCISDFGQLRTVLSNHINVNDSIFIATWSISETPIEFRSEILPLVSSFKAFLIAYQSQFNEVNNIEFFRNWTADQKNIKWYDWKIQQIPNNNRYLIGKRR
jgi:hypothetical protein